ncbi:DNA cytosine methyltransferase [Azonexus sp.]|uniref:DNA cytosine methyltransferase n=1 Tax=Azonexus sp. TaxID=1872668 RepID=UPI0039E59EB3
MNELHLFAGAGGGILAGQLLGHRCVCAVEFEPYAQAVLVARQNDGTFPPFPIWDDVRTFRGEPWRGIVDVVCGGFPCQDISAAGNGKGIDGERSGLWREMARIVGEVRPRFVFVENSPLLVGRGLAVVLGDLAEMGYDAQWACLSASDTGAPHQRDRVWIVANHRGRRFGRPEGREVEQPWRAEAICASSESEILANAEQLQSIRGFGAQMQRGRAGEAEQAGMGGGTENMANGHGLGQQRMVEEPQPRQLGRPTGLHRGTGEFPAWPADPADAPESGLGRVVNGMANRSHRLKAIGNGQVPICAAMAFRLLAGGNQ